MVKTRHSIGKLAVAWAKKRVTGETILRHGEPEYKQLNKYRVSELDVLLEAMRTYDWPVWRTRPLRAQHDDGSIVVADMRGMYFWSPVTREIGEPTVQDVEYVIHLKRTYANKAYEQQKLEGKRPKYKPRGSEGEDI